MIESSDGSWSPPKLTRGKYAPVFWEPLGAGGERLVIGFLVRVEDGPCEAHITLDFKKLNRSIPKARRESGSGIIKTAFEFFDDQIKKGVPLDGIQVLFRGMSIGKIEPISALNKADVVPHIIRLHTVLGHVPAPQSEPCALV